MVEFLQLLIFNSLDLSALFVDLLANLATFLKIVEAVLLGFLVVLMNLRSQLLRMFLKDFFLFLFNSSLLFLDLLLLLDNTKELISLLLCLFSETLFSLQELSLSGVFHVTEDLLLVLKVSSFLISGLTLSLFESALGS